MIYISLKKQKTESYNMNNEDINAWFHHLKGDNLFERDDEKFVEYRKQWQERPKNFDSGDFPLFLDVEVTNACNLMCPYCATTISNGKYKKGFIAKEHVEKMIEEGSRNGLYGIKFNVRGEPLLHPLIDYFVHYAKEHGLIDVYFNTNAMLLTKIMCRKLIDARLDRISISFDGYTKDVYEKNRVGSYFTTVIDNVKCLQNIKKELNVEYPRVRVQTIKLPEIDLDEYGNFWENMADEVAYLDYKDMGQKNKGVVWPAWKCPQLWQRMAVLWNGDIFPCNHDDELKAILGNVNSMSIKEAWFSRKERHMRTVHEHGGGHTLRVCDGCYLRNSEILKIKG